MKPSDKLREIAERDLNKRIVGILMAHGVNSIDAFNSTPDLTALISENYYPKEFLLWTGENCQYYPDTNEWMYFESPMTQQYFKGTDELFNYWKENEQ